MARALAHRGPDEHTIRRYGGKQPYAALGVERLSIVDREGGSQPASDPSGRWRVAFNGEIYNHLRLRKELQANGIEFQSQSDTEVLAALIAVNGLARALELCHGMFALAALDTKSRRLFLVRDRMGVKPLHWTQINDGTIAFASEIKGLREHPGIRWALDESAIQSFLISEYIPTPRTVWKGVHKVEPGMWVEINEAGIHHHRWWSPPVGIAGRPGNFERWATSLHGALQVAVSQRMEADVPIAYLLSGGIDSAAVAALAAQRSDGPIHTFSMGVEGAGFDESSEAADTARILGAQHHSAHIAASDLEGLLDQISNLLDEPLADSSLLATWKLMATVSDAGFKCALSGDGADEILGGYPTYLAHRLAGPVSPVRNLLGRLVHALPVRTDGVTNDYMAKRFVDGLGLPWQRRHQVWMGAWMPDELGAGDAIWDRFDHWASSAGPDPVARAMYLDQRTYLSDGVLVKVDRAAGAHGLEVRSPFLDHSIVELCAQMGSGHHTRGNQTKRVLREALEDVLPESVTQRRKKGFGVPVGTWLKGSATHLLDGLPEAMADWIPPATMRRCIDEHREGIADHRRRLWSALVLARWTAGPHGR
jgi:asparagine synthase (glutamine-hydrolysing)